MAPAPEALAFGLNYAIGFVAVHTAGATLATKQPALTASTLAAALDESSAGHSEMDGVVEVIVRTVRSQMIAHLGNFVVAFPVAVLICWPIAESGLPLMNGEKAKAALVSLHGLKILSFVYAAIVVSVFVMGLINLAVSFSATMYVVIRSRKSRFAKTPELLKKLLNRLRTRPLGFVRPPADGGPMKT